MFNNKFIFSFTSFVTATSLILASQRSYAQSYSEYAYVDPNYNNIDEEFQEDETYAVEERSNRWLWILGIAAVGAGAGIAATSGSGHHHHKKKHSSGLPITQLNPGTFGNSNPPNFVVPHEGSSPISTHIVVKDPVMTPPKEIEPNKESVVVVNPTTNTTSTSAWANTANTGHSLIFDFTLNASNVGNGITAFVQAPDGRTITAASFTTLSLNRTIVIPDPMYGSYHFGVIVAPSSLAINASLNTGISSDVPGRGMCLALPVSQGPSASQKQLVQEFTYEPDLLN